MSVLLGLPSKHQPVRLNVLPSRRGATLRPVVTVVGGPRTAHRHFFVRNHRPVGDHRCWYPPLAVASRTTIDVTSVGTCIDSAMCSWKRAVKCCGAASVHPDLTAG